MLWPASPTTARAHHQRAMSCGGSAPAVSRQIGLSLALSCRTLGLASDMTTGGVGIAGHGGLANAVASGVLDPAESCASATSGGAGAGAARFRAKTRVGLASSAGRDDDRV
jgi:hypothetical protein